MWGGERAGVLRGVFGICLPQECRVEGARGVKSSEGTMTGPRLVSDTVSPSVFLIVPYEHRITRRITECTRESFVHDLSISRDNRIVRALVAARKTGTVFVRFDGHTSVAVRTPVRVGLGVLGNRLIRGNITICGFRRVVQTLRMPDDHGKSLEPVNGPLFTAVRTLFRNLPDMLLDLGQIILGWRDW